MSNVIKVSPESFASEVEQAEQPVLVDFYADWCGPCKMIAPALETIAQEETGIKVVKVDADEAQDLMVKYGIRGIPTLKLFKNGEVVGTKVGAAPLAELKQFALA